MVFHYRDVTVIEPGVGLAAQEARMLRGWQGNAIKDMGRAFRAFTGLVSGISVSGMDKETVTPRSSPATCLFLTGRISILIYSK